MKFYSPVEATRLTEGDTSFEGLDVRNPGPDAFVLIPNPAGHELKVSVGQWLVKHSNGALEVRDSIADLTPDEEDEDAVAAKEAESPVTDETDTDDSGND